MLGLERLETRRYLLCAIKLFISWLMFLLVSFFKLAQYNSTRGHPLKLFYPDSRINIYQSLFTKE